MKKVSIFTVFLIMSLVGFSQERYYLVFEDFQVMENNEGQLGNLVKFPSRSGIMVLGGQHELNGMGNYLDAYGNKLIVERLDLATNGIRKVVLRREDGRNFYDVFPTLKAKLIPVTHTENTVILAE